MLTLPTALACAAAGLIGTGAWGALHPRAQLFGRVRSRLDPGRAGVALTFDDGPHPEWTPRVLDVLAAAGATATFFVVGCQVRRHPLLVRRIVAEGHALGLHSDRHQWWLALRPRAGAAADLAACAAAVQDAGGGATRWFRPPIGWKSPALLAAARDLGLETVAWSARGLDTVERDPARIAGRLLRGIAPGAILLLHDGWEPGWRAERAPTLAALALLLAGLRERGLATVSLAAPGPG